MNLDVVLQHPQPARPDVPAAATGGTVVLQCVASMAGTLVGETLGSTLTAKLAAGVLGALIGAFLTAPGRHRGRRIVAVALLLALLDALRRAGRALAAERRQPRHAWLPANWAVVGLTAVIGFASGSAVTTVRGGWDETRLLGVPEVRGEPRTAALEILTDAGLRAVTTREPSESIRRGSATRTDPAAGASVEEDAEVMLFISSGPPGPSVRVPDVTGDERNAALAVLQDVGLRPRLRNEPSRSIASGHATRTDPPAGTRVDRGAGVTLFVSSGSGVQPVAIPDVRGQARSAALAVLRNAGLRTRTRGEASDEITEGSATRTDPPAGTEIDRGAIVTLFVSSGPASTRVEVPDVTGSSRAEAYAVLEDTGLRPEGVSEPSDTVAAGIVVRTDPIAGTLVEEGAPVTVVASSGPSVIVVPEVVGRMSDDAVSRLQAVGLNATTSFVPEYATYGEVVESRPPAGTEMEPGDTVELFVSCAASVCD